MKTNISEYHINYKNNKQIPRLEVKGDLPILRSPLLANEDGIISLYTTRLGGVSTGNQASLNLSHKMETNPEHIRTNFELVAKALETEASRLVGGDQTHTNVVRVVDASDAGHNVTKPKSFFDVDALVTSDPSVALFVTTADCVPILFYDPVKRVVGAAHSGWKGTCNGIAAKVIECMRDEFGTNPADVLVSIGPSICQDCYEVSADLYEAFSTSEYYTMTEVEDIFRKKSTDMINAGSTALENAVGTTSPVKYQLDLWKANEYVLLNSGVLRKNIETTCLCTCCNPEVLYSHRASHGRRGGLGAFIRLL